MIGKTNSLAGGFELKYATGTGYWSSTMRVEGLDFTPIAVFVSKPGYDLTSPVSFCFTADEKGNFLVGHGNQATGNMYNIFKSGCSVFKGGFVCGAYGTISGSAPWFAMGV